MSRRNTAVRRPVPPDPRYFQADHRDNTLVIIPTKERLPERTPAVLSTKTLTVTDVASGWTECVALVVRDGTLVTEALTKLRKAMPCPLLGFDTDNGSEFLNEVVIAYCRSVAAQAG